MLTVVRKPTAQEDFSLLNELPEKISIHRAYSLKNRVSDFVLWNLAKLLRWRCLPLYEVEWFPFAVRKGKKILEREAAQVLISRSTPFTSHLVGLKLKSFSGVPWVADFSDLWTQNPYHKCTGMFGGLDRILERKVASTADRIIFTNRFARRLFLSKHKILEDQKVRVIPNQYDPENFSKQEKGGKRPETFTILYTGHLFGIRSPEPIFKALRELKDEGGISEEVKLRIVGSVSDKFRYLICRYKLEDVVEIIDTMAHKDVLYHLYSADVLLLIDAPTEGSSPFLPLKLAEYIRVGKPILAITPLEGASAEVVRSTKTGIIVPPNNIDSIKDEIRKFHGQSRSSKLRINPNWNEIYKYSANSCTRVLASVLEELVD